jgi:hypothetical protein
MPGRSPGSLRSSRNRALEIGTNPSGFSTRFEMCGQCGHPVTPGVMHSHYANQTAHSHYADPAEAAKPVTGGGASFQKSPFALGET